MSCSDVEVGSSPFSFRLSVCPMFPCDVFRPRIGRFRFGGFSKVGIRGCKVCRTKYYLSLRGWRFFRATARRLDLAAAYNPEITFAPATKMTTDAVWNDGMGTLAIHLERRKGKGGSTWDGATRHGESRKGAAQLAREGKPGFPAAVKEVPWPSLSCGHGLRSRVFFGGICLQTVLPAVAPSGKSRARRFGGRKHVTAGNGRRCRFTLAVSCIRRHFRLIKRRWEK